MFNPAVFIVIFFSLILIPILIVNLTPYNNAYYIITFVVAGFCALLIYAFFSIWREVFLRNKFRKELTAFAKSDDMNFFSNKNLREISSLDDVNLDYQSIIFQSGHNRVFPYLLENSECTIGSFQHMMKAGKNKIYFLWNFGYIRLDVKLPHVLFDNKKNNFLIFSTLPRVLAKNSTIKNGTLKEYFTVYTEQENEVVSFVKSDFIEKMSTYCVNFDVEIYDDNLFVYQKSKLLSGKDFLAIKNALTQLASTLNNGR